MDVLAEIREKLLSGKKPVELIKEGYAKSSVYHAAKKIRNTHSGVPGLPVDDEVAELRQRKEIIKLQKEIAELEATKDRLPDRVAALESSLERLPARIMFLEKQTSRLLDAVEDLYFEILGITLSVQVDDYGAFISRKRTEQDRDQADTKAVEFASRYRLDRG